MGLAYLPCMCDYLNKDPYMPQHRVMKELGMIRDYFLFMWHSFHVYNKEDTNVQVKQKEGEVNKDDNSDDDGIFKFMMDHVQKDQNSDDVSDEECSFEEEEKEKCGEFKKGSPSEKKIWYFELKHFINHVRDASVGLIMVLG
eukprot:13470099-Ditylum_brightwellii.AAC.1